MAFSAVMRRAVGAVRAYFQREWNEQLIDFDDIPAAAVPVLRQTYLLLGMVFGILALVANMLTLLHGIFSRTSVYGALFEISMGFFWFRFAMKWARPFSLFYCWIMCVCLLMSLESAAALSFHQNYSPFYTRRIYMTTVYSMIYATVYSQVMAERILRTGDINHFNHAVCFFTDFPFVTFRVCRMKLKELEKWLLP